MTTTNKTQAWEQARDAAQEQYRVESEKFDRVMRWHEAAEEHLASLGHEMFMAEERCITINEVASRPTTEPTDNMIADVEEAYDKANKRYHLADTVLDLVTQWHDAILRASSTQMHEQVRDAYQTLNKALGEADKMHDKAVNVSMDILEVRQIDCEDKRIAMGEAEALYLLLPDHA